jgi:UDP-N-acetylglucosamine--N-acetylmuramyl-(pentapeptide) pyrophosphoryl-undecaprenol N-acetylglucosamine transferase
VVVTGYPCRAGLQAWTKAEARTVFALRDDLPVLLVMGGSKGAHSINQAVFAVLPDLLKITQVLHIIGQLEWGLVEMHRSKLPVELQSRYRAYAYLHQEMGAALQAADLAVSRAGASILGEYPLFGLPAILVPYPYAWHYQRVNAQYLVRHEAATMIEDDSLQANLLSRVQNLLADQKKLDRMAANMRKLAHPQAADRIADHITALVSAAGGARR